MPTAVIGDLVKEWRAQRRRSQMDLAHEVGVSPRHLSFVETGRSAPSRGLVLRLAEHLEIPLRGRNELLLAAGFAPEYSQSGLDAPALSMVRVAIRQLLTGHNPYPALVVDRHWNLVEANAAADVLTEDVPDGLAELYRELRDYPGGSAGGGLSRPSREVGAAEVVVPLRLLHKDQELSLFTTTTLFGTPNDVTVEELAIESFYPADERTAAYLRSVAP
jgi:transcriptional regulator with XRE-family HTH domain